MKCVLWTVFVDRRRAAQSREFIHDAVAPGDECQGLFGASNRFMGQGFLPIEGYVRGCFSMGASYYVLRVIVDPRIMSEAKLRLRGLSKSL